MGRKSNFSDAQIIDVVKEVEGGAKATEVARRVGITVQTLARWRLRFSGVTVEEAKEKRRLEDENRRLRQLVAQYALDNEALKSGLGKKW